MGKYWWLLLSAWVNAAILHAQIPFRGIKIEVENDFINFRGEGTDRGYTNGMRIEWNYPQKNRHAFAAKLFPRISDSAVNSYGWGISQLMYTPCDIKTSKVQFHDRPYAGLLYITRQLGSSDPVKKQRLQTSISLGTIGRYSFAAETQTGVHKMIHYDKPEGWNNQIKTDILINYGIRYEKLVAAPSRSVDIIGHLTANLGSMVNDMALGLQLRIGQLNNYFAGSSASKNTHFFLFLNGSTRLVMDDASLQGGFFTHLQSSYTIPKDSLNRCLGRYEYGATMIKGRFAISIAENFQTAAFKGGYNEQAGKVAVYFGLQ